MSVEVGELSRICHLAFSTLHERRRIDANVPTEEVGSLIVGGVLHRPDYLRRRAHLRRSTVQSRGFRVAKVLNYMSLEVYRPTAAPHLPAIQC
jgi:hypothetical protein